MKNFTQPRSRFSRVILTACLGFVVASAQAHPEAVVQSLKDYLALRKQLGIKKAASVDALDVLIGSKKLEIRGKVKGAFEVDGRRSILVERSDNGTQLIDADEIPEWLIGREVDARLIVVAIRTSEADSLGVRLIAVAPESEVAKYDIVPPTPKPKSGGKVSRNSRFAPPLVSRGGSTVRGISDWLVQRYASFIKGQNRRLADNECLKISNAVLGYSVRYGVDPRLIMAILFCESGFKPNSTSHSGAMGLGQLMPDTARELGVYNAYDTTQNLYGTVKLIRGHLEKFSGNDAFRSLSLALAAYNAGPGAVTRHGGVPPYRETQRYVQKVVAVYRQLCRND